MFYNVRSKFSFFHIFPQQTLYASKSPTPSLTLQRAPGSSGEHGSGPKSSVGGEGGRRSQHAAGGGGGWYPQWGHGGQGSGGIVQGLQTGLFSSQKAPGLWILLSDTITWVSLDTWVELHLWVLGELLSPNWGEWFLGEVSKNRGGSRYEEVLTM